jgi:hypothetical protein
LFRNFWSLWVNATLPPGKRTHLEFVRVLQGSNLCPHSSGHQSVSRPDLVSALQLKEEEEKEGEVLERKAVSK